jgi:uncharacterized membrane protein
MKDRRLTEDAKKALVAAVKAVEAKSSAEVVVAVRKRASSYAGVHLLWSVALMYSVLLYQLYAPREFALHWIVVNPLLVMAGWFLLLRISPPLARASVPARLRREATQAAARGVFFDRGVRLTSDRIGILIVFYQLERVVEVVADQGIVENIPPEDLRSTLDAIRLPYATDRGFLETAAVIERSAEVFATHLPVRDDDVNELSDEVDHG